MEQEPMATQDANMPNITNDSELNRGYSEPAGEESETDDWVMVPRMGPSTGPSEGTTLYSVIQILSLFMSKWNYIYSREFLSTVFSRLYPNPSVKVHMLVAGETFQAHETFIQKLKLQIELCSAESSSVILVFCTVVSQIRTDMEAAMSRVSEDKPVILVFMHHCHLPSYMPDITVQPSRSNIVQVVHCAFHEFVGLLQCQENEQAARAVRSALLRFCSSVDVQAEIPLTQSETEQQPVAARNANRPIITNEVPRTSTKPMTVERESGQGMIVPAKGHSTAPSGGTSLWSKTRQFSFSKRNWNISSVKVHMLVAGETFQAHKTFIQKLNLQIELCSAESSNVILVFCPVVSQIRTDMEAAMARVTEDKPVILVLMHHCHNPSHMTNITAEPSRSNIEQVVHCAYHETKGLLRCWENEQAVAEVQAALKRYK